MEPYVWKAEFILWFVQKSIVPRCIFCLFSTINFVSRTTGRCSPGAPWHFPLIQCVWKNYLKDDLKDDIRLCTGIEFQKNLCHLGWFTVVCFLESSLIRIIYYIFFNYLTCVHTVYILLLFSLSYVV